MLLDVLQQLAERQSKNIFSFDEIKSTAAEIGFGSDRVSSLIDTLNNEGFLLKKGASVFQLRRAEY